MKATSFAAVFSALFLLVSPQLAHAQKAKTVDFSRLVVVGDSLSAGFQNFSLLDTQQSHGYASLVAQQAGTSLTLPRVPYPGAPNVLSLVSLGPPPVIAPVSGTLPTIPRDNPTQQPTNLAVPGVTIAQVLTQRPNPAATSPIDQLANIVLGFPSPFLVPGPARTQLEEAVALKPTTVIAWAGNNDALLPALTGSLVGLTPVDVFQSCYKTMLDTLSATNATLITANIPDVTEVGYFEPMAQVAAQAKLPLETVTSMLGAGPQDYVRVSAMAQAQEILTGQANGPLTTCPSPLPGVGPSEIPCVLTASDAQILRDAVAAYNTAIATEAAAHGAVLVDIHGLVDRLSTSGINISGQQLTTSFLGGLFSFDGFHPTNTGYAVIANQFIDTINQQLNTTI
ncbi:MAG TPA: SGNH/GDSL hydrolase family protein, partial [Bryobacteraceae bacterium]